MESMQSREDFEERYQHSYKIECEQNINKFELIITLGQGSFGRVLLVVFKKNKLEYALKVLDKSKIVKYNQMCHIQSEIRILNAIQHPNIIIMHSLFDDNSHIYLLMEYVRAGDLFSYIKTLKIFQEHITLFFAAQIVLAFEYLHSFNIIYRDLKPENILVDHHGYLKLADFDFAKRIQQRTYTLCGTPDYFSPEIIQSKGHGKPTDWWTLGVLIYEMNVGYPPFRNQSDFLLFEAICRKKPSMRVSFTFNCKKIILNLLQKDPTKRLGSNSKGSKAVKEHPWFAKINFQSIYRQQIPSPFDKYVITKSIDDCRQESRIRNETPIITSEKDDYKEYFKDF